MRIANLKRETGETRINITVKLDGQGEVLAKTGFKFIDHLVCTFGKYSMADIDLRSKSHDSISHHLIEDIGITLGKSLDKALGRRSAITRLEYGNNDHHKIESAIKAFAIAFREAASGDSKRIGIPSTKGAM